MAQQFFGGTIQTLSNLIQQEKRQRFLKQSPQYQQALFNLMQTKEQAARLDAIRGQIASGNLSTEEIAQLGTEFLAGEGKFDPALAQVSQERADQHDLKQIKVRGEQRRIAAAPGLQATFEDPAPEVFTEFAEGDPSAVAGLKLRQQPQKARVFDRQDYANLFFKFQDRATKFSSDFQTVQNNLLNIVASVDRLVETPDSEENRIAVQQAIITSFNKITDPTSVVRESEYARTPEGASLINRLKGAYEKITKGGKLTEQDNIEIKNTAIEIAELRRKILNQKLVKQVREPAARFGIGIQDVESIAPLFQPLEDIQATPKPTPQPTDTTTTTGGDTLGLGGQQQGDEVDSYLKDLGL